MRGLPPLIGPDLDEHGQPPLVLFESRLLVGERQPGALARVSPVVGPCYAQDSEFKVIADVSYSLLIRPVAGDLALVEELHVVSCIGFVTVVEYFPCQLAGDPAARASNDEFVELDRKRSDRHLVRAWTVKPESRYRANLRIGRWFYRWPEMIGTAAAKD